IQWVVNLVDDPRAEPAQRREFLSLHQLGLGFLELLDGGFERLVLPGELALILVGIDKVLDADMKFGCRKWLWQEIARAGVERGQLGLFVSARREQNHRYALRGGPLAQFAASL